MRRPRRNRVIVGRWYWAGHEWQYQITPGQWDRVAYLQPSSGGWWAGVTNGPVAIDWNNPPKEWQRRKRWFGRRCAAKRWAVAELSRALREDESRR